MGTQITIQENLFTTYKSMGLPAADIDDSSGFTINRLESLHPEIPFKSNGYRPNYFSLLLLKDARGSYTTDDTTYNTKPGTIYFTNPGHFKSFEWFETNDAVLITFNESFLKENIRVDIFNEFPFLLSERVPPKTLPVWDFKAFENIYVKLFSEYSSSSSYKDKVIGSLLRIMLLRIKDLFWKDYNPIYEGSRSSQIVKKFKQHLESHFRELITDKVESALKVHDYADLQQLNASYFNEVVKTKTGKPVSIWIREKTILEAKTLLNNTSFPIKKIAFLLGFSEVPHFSNHFKKNTGLSPSAFRKR